MLYNVIIAALRTGIAALVGLVITAAVARGIELDEGTSSMLITLLFGASVMLYNGVVNWLALKVHPAFGYLLGAPGAPEYRAVAAKQADGQVVATELSPLPTGEIVYVAQAEPHDPEKVDNAEGYPY